jgi:DNA-binding CsgD family transcriptional regulator
MDSKSTIEYLSFLGIPPVGRDHELRVLQWLFQKAQNSLGRLVLVSGEAGIGKTTLVEQFADDAAESASVISGACIDLAAPSPYAPWKEAFAHLPSLDAARQLHAPADAGYVDQETRVREIQRSLASAADDRPLVLILEDIHWADTESLSLLRSLARAVRTMPVMIIATYRDDELAPGNPLYDVLLPLVREAGAERIPLRRLGSPDIVNMISERYRLPDNDAGLLADELQRRTGGNPFYIVELLRSMEHSGVLRADDGCWRFDPSLEIEIPMLVRQLIERRMQELSPQTRAMLQYAAILGFELRLDLLAALLETEESDLAVPVREALSASLLEQSPRSDRLQFRHALVQEALYARATIPWRQAQHRRAAEIFSSIPETDPASVALHFQRAGDHRARNWLLVAARRARQVFAPFTVIQHLNAVLDEPLALDSGERMEAYRLRGWAHMITGDFEAANHDFLAEVEAARSCGDHQAEWDACIRLAELWTGRDYQRVGAYVDQTLRVARELNDHALMARSHSQFGTWCMSQDDPDDARGHHEAALQICQSAGDQAGTAEAHDLLALTLTLSGKADEAGEHFREAAQIASARNDRQSLSTVLANRAHLAPNYLTDMVVAISDLEASIHDGLQARAIAREIGYRVGEAYAEIRLGYNFGAHGEYQDALESTAGSIAGSEAIGNRQMMSAAHALAGQLRLDLLEPETARSHSLESGDIARRIDSTFRIRMAEAIGAMSHVANGDIDSAERLLLSVWPDSDGPRTLAQQLLWRARIELEIGRGDPYAAMRYIDAALDKAPNASLSRPALRLSYLRGRALNLLHDHASAEAWLDPALDAANRLGARSLKWRILSELGSARYGRGDRAGASAAFAEARDLVERLSDTVVEPDLQSRFLSSALAHIPEPRTPTPLQAAKHASGGLTRRQRQVATLIAGGKSNREIADRLSISERTVESHVSSILATLNAASRAQVVAWCIEHGLHENKAQKA